nr:MAG TPA: hypothetical protein [Caudoviricetes sp.]
MNLTCILVSLKCAEFVNNSNSVADHTNDLWQDKCNFS